MTVGNLIIIIFIIFYIRYFIQFFSKKKRKQIQTVNKSLDELRKIPIKTLEQQKQFLELRYPKRIGFKFKWVMVLKILFLLGLMFVVFRGFYFVFGYFNINVPTWLAFMVVIIGPIIINLILKKSGLQKTSDLSVFFRGGNKNDGVDTYRAKGSKKVGKKTGI